MDDKEVSKGLIVDAIESNGVWLSEKAAIVSGGKVCTYGELHLRSNQVADYLNSIGIKKGDCVALLSGSSVQHFEVIYGAMKLGAVIAPISTMLKQETVNLLVKNSGAKCILIEPGCTEENIEILGVNVIYMNSRYEGTLDECSPENRSASITAKDICSLLYSSGTTGVPKGILHSYTARGAYAFGFSAEYGINSDSRVLLTTPAYSNGSWMMILPALYMGATLVIHEKFDATSVIEEIENSKITHAFMVPTQIEGLLASNRLPSSGLDSIKGLISAGSHLRLETKTKVLNEITANLYELYGNTEGVATILKPWHMDKKMDTVGLPITSGKICILSESGEKLSCRELGEIAGRSIYMSEGYHDLEDANTELFWFDEAGDRYVKTGDIGYIDDDGFLKVVGRIKDMIVSGGINVYASDLEEIVAKHPDVIDVAVIAVPDQKWGETPLAMVIKGDNSTISEEGIRNWANERLGRYQRISHVRFTKEFPRNSLGKVIKNELKEAYLRMEENTVQ